MFLGGRLWPFDQFFVPAAFALPQGIHGVWISGVLVHRSFRRDYFSAAAWASASAGGALFDIDIQQLALIVHSSLRSCRVVVCLSAGFAMTISQNKNRTKD
jgi:hypothetical protein